jgi:hypothetical protein
MGMNNATWEPLKRKQPLIVCLLPGEHMPLEGPYEIAPGTKICGADPDSVAITGGGIAWERPVFLLRSGSDLNGDTTPDDVTEGFARILFEEFIIKDMKHLTQDIDLIHVSGVRTVTFQDIIFDTIVDINDYFIDCRNNATCLFSNVYFKQSEGGSVLITNNATASFVNCNVEGFRSTRNALKFESAHSVIIATSNFKSTKIIANRRHQPAHLRIHVQKTHTEPSIMREDLCSLTLPLLIRIQCIRRIMMSAAVVLRSGHQQATFASLVAHFSIISPSNLMEEP